MGREGGIEDGGQSFLGTRTCVTQTCTKDQVVPELGDGEVPWQGNRKMGRGLSLGFGKVLVIEVACGRLNFCKFLVNFGKKIH